MQCIHATKKKQQGGSPAVLYCLPARRHGHDHDLHRRHGHRRSHDGAPHMPAVQHHPQGDDRRACGSVRDRNERSLDPGESHLPRGRSEGGILGVLPDDPE